MNEQQSNGLEKLPNWLPWVVGGTALLLVIFYAGTFHRLPTNQSPSAWGSFGDYVGGLLNPLVSTFTLIVAVRVWQLQKDELKKTQKSMADQAKTAEQERSEQRFFDVLNLYFRTVESFEYRAASGRSAMKAWSEQNLYDTTSNPDSNLLSFFMKHGFEPVSWNPGAPQFTVTVEALRNAWDTPAVAEFLAPYFRVVFRLLTDAEYLFTDPDDRRRYMKLFRAQLSANELTLIGLNLWLSNIGQNMRPVAITYGILKHLPKGYLRTKLEQDIPEVFGSSYTHLTPSTLRV